METKNARETTKTHETGTILPIKTDSRRMHVCFKLDGTLLRYCVEPVSFAMRRRTSSNAEAAEETMPELPPVVTVGTLTLALLVTVDMVAVVLTNPGLSTHTAVDVTGIMLVADIVATVVSPNGALLAASAHKRIKGIVYQIRRSHRIAIMPT
jgi:hypothetical protein